MRIHRGNIPGENNLVYIYILFGNLGSLVKISGVGEVGNSAGGVEGAPWWYYFWEGVVHVNIDKIHKIEKIGRVGGLGKVGNSAVNKCTVVDIPWCVS